MQRLQRQTAAVGGSGAARQDGLRFEPYAEVPARLVAEKNERLLKALREEKQRVPLIELGRRNGGGGGGGSGGDDDDGKGG